MVAQKQIIRYLSENKCDISQRYHLKKLGIFGSYARNEQTPESDLDLLVEFEDNTSNLTFVKEFLRKEMQSVFNIPVDICREKYIKPIFRQQILSDAIYV
jgi:predicted nucleotidyltransferase